MSLKTFKLLQSPIVYWKDPVKQMTKLKILFNLPLCFCFPIQNKTYRLHLIKKISNHGIMEWNHDANATEQCQWAPAHKYQSKQRSSAKYHRKYTKQAKNYSRYISPPFWMGKNKQRKQVQSRQAKTTKIAASMQSISKAWWMTIEVLKQPDSPPKAHNHIIKNINQIPTVLDDDDNKA